MNIAIPVSAHDKHLLPKFIEVLQHFGGLEDSTICLFATPSAKQEAYDAAAKISAAVHTFEVDFAGGWPIASSTQFAATVFTLPKLGWNAPWLWMELDMLPVQKDWLQTLRRGYTLCGHPFMGNVVPTAWIEDGKLVVHEDDLMMMGCGVYPANMHADERFRPLLTDLIKPAPMNPATPFDFYLRHAMRQAGIADTRLIADMWQTHKYRRTADGIVCEPVPLDKPRRERGGLVPAEAVLVHGCKDSTLAELVLGASFNPSKEELERVRQEHIQRMAGKVSGIMEDEDKLKEMSEKLHANIAVTDKLPPGVGAAIVTPATPSMEVVTQVQKTDTPLTEREKDVVMDGMKNYIGELIDRAYPPTGNVTLSEEDFEAAKAAAIAKTAEKHPVEAKRVFGTDTLKPKPLNRSAVESARKQNGDNAKKTAAALGLSFADFVKQLPTLGYVIVKGGKLQSTQL